VKKKHSNRAILEKKKNRENHKLQKNQYHQVRLNYWNTSPSFFIHIWL